MRSVLTQAFYQIFVMLLLLYAGPAMFKIQYNLYTTELRTQIGDEEYPTNRLLHQTLMFQVFVMMNMFNMRNCVYVWIRAPFKKTWPSCKLS